MTSAESSQRAFSRVVGVLLALVGVSLLSLVAVLVRSLRGGPVMWALVAMTLLLSLKAGFALLGGVRLVRNREGSVISPVEWRAMGVGYCAVAAFLLAAALAGEGWGYALAALLFGGLAPVWLTMGRRAGSDVDQSYAPKDSSPLPHAAATTGPSGASDAPQCDRRT
jgi:hypothetical protein